MHEPGKERYSINKGLDPVGWYQYNNKTGVSGTSDTDKENNTYYSFPANNDSFSTDSTGFRVVRSRD